MIFKSHHQHLLFIWSIRRESKQSVKNTKTMKRWKLVREGVQPFKADLAVQTITNSNIYKIVSQKNASQLTEVCGKLWFPSLAKRFTFLLFIPLYKQTQHIFGAPASQNSILNTYREKLAKYYLTLTKSINITISKPYYRQWRCESQSRAMITSMFVMQQLSYHTVNPTGTMGIWLHHNNVQ